MIPHAGAWRILAAGILLTLVLACGLDSRHLVGRYYLLWDEGGAGPGISLRLPTGDYIGRIEPRVLAVACDDHFIVAERADGFYILDIGRDGDFKNPSDSVSGPLAGDSYAYVRKTLHVPDAIVPMDI